MIWLLKKKFEDLLDRFGMSKEKAQWLHCDR